MNLPTATELWRLSATELAEAIRTRQVSIHEVIEAMEQAHRHGR
jgi:Asp-tRNA(Asn)/Glu-tRNA(Gln) amidotransferase A subunit family amidase